MPFKSKAQQRMMFAKHPRLAKEWAAETPDIKSLPEKVNEGSMKKKAESDGRFFEKRALTQKGRFFRDLDGRDDGMFMGKAAAAPGAGVSDVANDASAAKADQSSKLNIGATGAPMGGSGFRGAGMGGGMYGTGDGGGENDTDLSDDTKGVLEDSYGHGTGKKPKGDETRLMSMLDKAGPGKTRRAAKTAAASPTDWDADTSLPTGFHRPTHEQPEELEAGGERFHSTEMNSISPAPFHRHGLVEGGQMSVKGTASSQMGKHAGVSRFMGTSFGIEKGAFVAPAESDESDAGSWVSNRANEFKGSLGRAASGAGHALSEGVKGVTTSPVGATLAGLVALRLGLGGARRLGRIGRGTKAVSGVAAKASGKGGLIGKLMSGARDAVSSARNFVTK